MASLLDGSLTCGRLCRSGHNIRSLSSGSACGANADLTSELVAAPGDGADELAIGAKGFAERDNLARQPVLFDDPALPNLIQQPVLADHRSRGFD